MLIINKLKCLIEEINKSISVMIFFIKNCLESRKTIFFILFSWLYNFLHTTFCNNCRDEGAD